MKYIASAGLMGLIKDKVRTPPISLSVKYMHWFCNFHTREFCKASKFKFVDVGALNPLAYFSHLRSIHLPHDTHSMISHSNHNFNFAIDRTLYMADAAYATCRCFVSSYTYIHSDAVIIQASSKEFFFNN